jgi:hypothetical protein
MVGKAGVIISLIVVIINYGTSRPLFLWLSDIINRGAVK